MNTQTLLITCMLISYYDEDVPNMYRLLERIQTDGLLLERLNEYEEIPMLFHFKFRGTAVKICRKLDKVRFLLHYAQFFSLFTSMNAVC